MPIPYLVLLKRFWWVIPVTLFAAWVVRIDSLRAAYKRDAAACQANFAQFAADVKAKTELARAEDAAHKAQVERDQNKVSQESDHEIRQRIAAAVAAVHVRLQPAPPTHSSGGGSSGLSAAPDPANDPAGAGAEAIVPTVDLTICVANTVKAEGWQDWWKSVQAVPR